MTATNPPSPPSQQSKNVFRLHGVNVLNRKNVDSIARLTALERRRATHILDERQRRDTMNQLLTELASLVQESAAQATLTTTTTPPQPSLRTRPASTTTTPTLNTDGTDKRPARPPVKSNSITTLRNAIAEIRRLRACAGLQAISSSHTSSSSSSISGGHHHHHLASSSSSITSRRPPRSPSHSQRSSCSRSTSPVSFVPKQHASSSSLSTLAALATQHREGLEDEGSQHSGGSCSSPSPVPSPRLQASSSSYSLRAFVSSSSSSSLSPSSSLAQEAYARDPAARHQLHSPPLSPSSPLTSSQYHFSGGAGGGPFFLASMASLDGSNSHLNGSSGPHPHMQPQPQPQQQQQQPYLPPLASVVSPMSSMTFLSPQEREDEREYRSRTQTECVSSMGQFEYQPAGPWGGGGGGPSSSCPVE